MKKISLIFIILIMLISCAKTDELLSGMKLISNNFVTYNFYVPDSWIVISDNSTGYTGAYVSENDRSNVTVTTFEIKEQITTDEFWEKYKEDFNSTFSEIEFETVSKILLDGYEANCYEYTAKITGITYKYMQVVRLHGGYVYIMTYTAVPEYYEEHLEKVANIINKFKFK